MPYFLIFYLAKEVFIIRPRAIHFAQPRGSTVEEELKKVAELLGIMTNIANRAQSMLQNRQGRNRDASVRRNLETVLTSCIGDAVGAEETGENFANCEVYNLLVHDFGTEKIRFVCNPPSPGTSSRRYVH